jgi:O-antigen/teichoic acid export membrane protein
MPLFAAFAACAPALIIVVMGDAWEPSIPVTQFLAIGTAFGFTSVFAFSLFSAIGRPGLGLVRGTLDVGLTSCLTIIFAHRGIQTVAAIWALRQALFPFVNLTLCFRFLQLDRQRLISMIATAVRAAFATGALALMAAQEIMSHLPPAQSLAILIPLCGVLFAAAVGLQNPSALAAVMTRARTNTRLGTRRSGT